MSYTAFTHLMMFGWLPVVVGSYAVARPQRATIFTLIFAWLFLPNAEYDLPGLPSYTKMTATVVGILIGTFLFDQARLVRFRPSIVDLPMAAFCFAPFPSSVMNGLGAYDGVSSMLTQTVQWGFPFLIGRLYFNNLSALREFAYGIFIGGLIYAPLCLWEIRMSPQLHNTFYGFTTRPFSMAIRYGGYRPLVFMWTFLPVTVWLSIATVVGARFYLGGRMRSFMGIPMWIALGGLFGTLVLAKMYTGLLLTPLGVVIPWLSARLRSAAPYLIVLVAIPCVIGLRGSGMWSARGALAVVEQIDPARAHSLRVRLETEDRMVAIAWQQPLFGAGGWGRSRHSADGEGDVDMVDGLWIITFGTHGLFGLAALVALFFFPLWRFAKVFPARTWNHPAVVPASAIAAVGLIVFVNNIPNYTANPIVTASLGGLALIRRPVSRKS